MTSIILLGALLTFFAVQRPGRVLPGVLRLAAVAVPAGLITAYFTVPFALHKGYINVSPYLQRFKLDSFGANAILSWLLKGEFLDFGRLPVMTLLLVIGIAWALSNRTQAAMLACGLFLLWLLIYFGRPTWGQLLDLLPFHDELLFHRFSSGVDLAAILLVGLGGEWVWRQCLRLHGEWAPALAAGVILMLMLPAMRERYADYSTGAQWMRETEHSFVADADAAAIIAMLKTLPPGRTYAGLRSNWGASMHLGHLNFWDLLTYNAIPAVSPPYQGLSLNSDLIFHFNDNDAAHYRLFNIRYVVAPSTLRMTTYFTLLKKTARYTLYQAPSGGYTQQAQITAWKFADSQQSLFAQNRAWMLSPDPAASRFIRWSYMGSDPGPGLNPWDLRGTVNSEAVSPGQIDVIAAAPNTFTLVFKMTYHPDWYVEVDGREQPAFMVSPSFIGVAVPAGTHVVRAIYKSNRLKDVLLIVGFAVAILTFIYGAALAVRLESFLRGWTPAEPGTPSATALRGWTPGETETPGETNP